ncbi:DUF5312 family protein [Entomospira entomophila]|uniref:Uncharacterized protein n=1 Tax=Entomospira entomophila TaxID=2719988 RepID=A0A968KTV2_9SPIO|nr:DUF5312 family protein [Entomospira entomophilus]NIZ40741.1 hypothetical protein [Entomospira entomophilus]WDI34954.1 DUF5312 family protein [Entomospira entomophilus]
MNTPVFDRLVSLLSADERKAMLEQISMGSSSVDTVNFVRSALSESPYSSIVQEYKSLSFWQKIWYQILAYIDKRTKEEMLHQKLLEGLSLDITRNFGEYVSFERSRFLSAFCDSFVQLANAVQIFKKPLDDILGEHRKEYYAFLVGVVDPSTQKKLLIASNPEFIIDNDQADDSINSSKLRTMMEEKIQLIIKEMTLEVREKLYFYARQIAHLERLSNFNYDKIIASYSTDNTCTIRLISKSLKKLNGILSSFKEIPDQALLQSIFLFSYSVKETAADYYHTELQKDLAQAMNAVTAINHFARIPLTEMLAVIGDNYFYEPAVLSGGEDWLALYRKFWKGRSNRLYQEFLVSKKANSIDRSICDYYKLTAYPSIDGYASAEWQEEIFAPVHEGSIGLVYFFFTHPYQDECLEIVQRLHAEGNFFRKENAKELADAVSSITLLNSEIAEFERAMSPSGGYFYIRLQEFARGEKSVGLAGLHALIEKHVTLILNRSTEVLFILSSVFGGVIERTIGGRYDTISNFDALGLSRKRVEQVKEILTVTYQFLVDKRDLEERVANLALENREEVETTIADSVMQGEKSGTS